jgi:hypothetical protein
MKLHPGFNTRVTRNGAGDTLARLPGGNWKHPWFTRPSWSSAAGGWVATVKAGNVNGIAPAFRATIEQQQQIGNPWEINPLTGKQFFSASVFDNSTSPASTKTVDVPLYLNPQIPLSFYAIGWDGDANRAVPQFFLNLGAANTPPQPSIDDLLSGNADISNVPQPPPNLRLLRACDIWVHQPRVALTSSVAQNLAGLLTGQPSIIQTLGVRLPSPSDRLQILAGEFAPADNGAQIDPLSSDFEEPNFDEILVSQVYLLSPPNTAPGSAPDATWTPYVRHAQGGQCGFWNLMWAQPSLTFAQTAATNAASVGNVASAVSGLGLGVGTLIISSFESQLSNAEQQALNILEAASLAGTFWVATGGGAEITPMSTTAPAPKLGQNIYANLAARTRSAQQTLRTQSLDPVFPYGGLRFNTNLFRNQ